MCIVTRHGVHVRSVDAVNDQDLPEETPGHHCHGVHYLRSPRACHFPRHVRRTQRLHMVLRRLHRRAPTHLLHGHCPALPRRLMEVW